MIYSTLAVFFLLSFVVASARARPDCFPGPPPNCPQWHVGIDRVRPSGHVVHGHANVPVGNGGAASVHGSHVLGGPHNGAQTVGGGLGYQHPSGVHGAVDATHIRGQGNTYSGTVGGSGKVGPGTLTVGGGVNTVPGSSKVQGQVGASYSVPLP